jgi:hypothetical protein
MFEIILHFVWNGETKNFLNFLRGFRNVRRSALRLNRTFTQKVFGVNSFQGGAVFPPAPHH